MARSRNGTVATLPPNGVAQRAPSNGRPWSAASTLSLASGSLALHVKRGAKPDGKTIARAVQNAKAYRVESLTAAATRITSTPARDRVTRHLTTHQGRAWQEEVIAAYRQVGELRYIANTTANAASRAHVFPAGNEATTSALGEKTTANEDQESSERGAPEGTVDSEIVRRLVLLLVLIGEAYLVELPRGRGRPAAGQPERETHVLAPMDVTFPGHDMVKIGEKEYPLVGSGAARITRVHRPDVRNAEEPDSPARSALPVLRELIGLSMHVSATIDSRVAGAGIFYYPSDATVARPSGTGPTTGDMEFPDALQEAMITPISDRDVASAVAPVLLGIPPGPDMKDSIGWIVSPNSTFDPNITNMRTENIRRIALGMDAPPEVILGAKGLSHFGAWSVEGEFIRLQIAPVLRLIAQALTVAFGVEYTFDTGPLTVRPNLAVEAQALYDRDAISGTTLRAATGFSEDDAPKFASKDEEAMDMARGIVKDSPSVLQTPGLPAIVDQCRIVLGLKPMFTEFYPGQPAAPLAGGPGDVNGRDEPRDSPPSGAPRSNRPVSDGSPEGGGDGKPHDVPGTT